MEIKERLKEKKEVIKGRPVKYCPDCGRKKWSCRCYKEEKLNAQRRLLSQSQS